MAYGLNFYSEWADNEGFIYRTEILKRDYSGAATEVTSGGTPFVVSLMDDATTDVFHAVRTQKAEIEWISDAISGFDISDIFITDDQEYQIKFGKINPDNEDFYVLWSGYLTFTDCKEPFLPKPYAVQLAGLCGLALMRDQAFLDADGKFVEGIRSLMDIIVMCLAQANLDLEIDVHVGLKSQLANPIPLSQTYIDTDGLRGLTAYEVLDGILSSVNAFITQQDNSWLIRGIREQQADSVSCIRFTSGGDFLYIFPQSQVVTIGSEELAEANPGYVNVLPMSDVMESLAEPYSLVTNVVSPGIPVNLLNNGTFNPDGKPWGINLGAMSGWANSPEPKGWRYEGTGTPDDPFRFIMIGSVKTTGDIVYDQKDPNIQAYTTIYNTEPITIYRDGGKDSYPNIKIKVSGAFRMRDGGRLMIAARLNDGDKDYVQWLDENGTWTPEKKFVKRTNIKVTGDTPHNPEEYLELANIPLQTFEVTSSKLPDYLNRPGGWIAKLYFNIYPTAVGADTFPEISNNFSPALWLEDFCVSITTETKFEGEHDYQIDGKKLIRNGDEYEYTTLVADKINIKTAHQKRDTFRVMTGYATVGIAYLTETWQRYISGAAVGTPEPLQHLTLRERLRLLCGKRRVLEGTFYGEGVGPANSVINRFDGDPESYYTITGWSWDVKNRMFQMRIHELDFTPLEDEVITLTDSRDNGRGNRRYTNSGGSSASGAGSGKGVTIPIEFDPIPTLYFTVGKTEIKGIPFADYIISEHTPEELTARVLHFDDDYISYATFDRGTKNAIMDLVVTGIATKPGTDRILVEFTSDEGDVTIVAVNVISFAAPKAKYSLYDTSSGEVLLGEITQGAGFPKPDSWKVKVNYTGFHEAYFASMIGPGLNSSVTPSPYLPIEQIGTYDFVYYLPSAGSYVSEVGTHNMVFATFRNEGDPDAYAEIKRDEIKFILYDEEYLSKVKFELWVDGAKFGDINPDGSSAFNTEGKAFQIKIIVADLPHDLATAILTRGGADVKTHVYTADPSIEDAEYELYESTPSPQPEGLYELNFSTSDVPSETVYDRLVAFTINKKKVAPTGGELQLVTMRANQTAYDIMGSLGLSGGLFTLPANGWNVALPGVIAEGTTRSVVLLQKKGDDLVSVNIELYTGQPQTTSYSTETEEDFLIFGTLSSKNIDKIHVDPSSFRVTVTDEIDGEVSAVYSADFSFGVLEDLDDLPISEPGNTGDGIQDYVADDETLEQEDEEYTRTFSVKDKGVTYVKFQDMPGATLHGNLTTSTGVSYAVPVLIGTSSTAPSDSTLGTTLWVRNQLGTTVSGLTGRLAKFATNTSLTYSILEESGILLTARQGIFVADNTSNASVRGFSVQENGSTRFSFGKLGAGADFAFWRFADNGGTVLGTPIGIERATGKVTLETQLTIQGAVLPPLIVSSTALVTNFNADLLDGQHGAYYLARANHTGTQLASTISNFSAAVLATTLTGLSTSNSAITSSDTILQAFGKVQGQLTGNISGTVGRLAKFTATNAIGASILEESGISLTARQGIFVADNTSNTNVRGFAVQEGGSTRFSFGKLGTAADFAFWRYADNGSTVLGTPIGIERSSGKVTLETQLTIQGSVLPPLVVSSTALVTSFNSDLLDGQHGAYYLDWDNLTDKKSILAGNGLAGGGLLDSDRTITLGTPSTLNASTTNSVSGTTHTHAITTGNLIQGSNVTLSGTLTNRLIGSGDVTISATSMPWPNITSKPTTIGGFGIVDAPTFGDLSSALSGKEDNFSKGNLIQGSGITLSGTLTSRLVGSGDVTISASLPSNLVTGTGSAASMTYWVDSDTVGYSGCMFQAGSGQISIIGNLIVEDGFFRPPEKSIGTSGVMAGEIIYAGGSNWYAWNGSAWKKFDVL